MSRSRKSTARIPAVIARQFGWLEQLGFTAVEGSESWGPSATYATETVLVRPSFEDRDEYADVTVARRRTPDVQDEPYWAQVHLAELLERRAPESGLWAIRDSGGRKAMEAILTEGASLLRTYGQDLLEGRNLDLLDDIIQKRPRLGVPGLDFPADEPWAMSAEGVLFTTGSERARGMEVYLERSRSYDPDVRAVAALHIGTAGRGTRDRTMLAALHHRLHALLADPEADVYRAAASALGEWQDADALDEILKLLESEPGDRMSPVAASATFIAIDRPKPERRRVVEALRRFASRHSVAAKQVDQLAWRLGEGQGRRYPRAIRVWRGPDT